MWRSCCKDGVCLWRLRRVLRDQTRLNVVDKDESDLSGVEGVEHTGRALQFLTTSAELLGSNIVPCINRVP